MSVTVLYQSAPSTSRPPDCLALLRCLDAIIDRFNGDHDKGDKSSLLHPRHAHWRRAYKYESEDLNEVLTTFLRLCPDPIFGLQHLPAYLSTVRQGFQQEHPERLAAFESTLAPCLAKPVPLLKEVFDAVSKHGGQLWLRAALALDLQPATPWPVFPAALAQSLRRSLCTDEDMIWGRQHTLHELESLGWSWSADQLTAQDQAKIDGSQRALLADSGIFQQPAGHVSWIYDPITGRWRTGDDLRAPLPGKVKCLMTSGAENVLLFYELWTEEEKDRAWKFSDKVTKGELKLPPRPPQPAPPPLDDGGS